MIKRFLEYIGVRPRTLVVVLGLLFLVDGAVRYYWAGLYSVSGRVRLANEELASMQTMRHEIESAKGYKILFLGDSAAYGSAVKDSSQTVPAYLEQELQRLWPGKKVKVFNFAFKGFGMSENYFVLNSLADAGLDMVIYNVSVGWFNREKALEHPNVVRLSENYFGNPRVDKAGVKTERGIRDKLADRINRSAGAVWSLYQNRSAITTFILGKSLRTKLNEYQLAINNPAALAQQRKEDADLYRPWYEKDWSIKLGQAGYKVGHLNLSRQNPQVVFYNLMLDLLAQKRVKAVFYTSPQNFTLLERYNMLDRPAWNSGIASLHAMTVQKGLYFTDYSTLVDNRYFSDTVHLLAPGHQLVARQLARDISGELGGIRK